MTGSQALLAKMTSHSARKEDQQLLSNTDTGARAYGTAKGLSHLFPEWVFPASYSRMCTFHPISHGRIRKPVLSNVPPFLSGQAGAKKEFFRLWRQAVLL